MGPGNSDVKLGMGFPAHQRDTGYFYRFRGGWGMRGILRAVFFVVLVAGLLFSSSAYGQGGATGAISGTVMDVNGGTVADADVQIFNTATDLLVRRANTGTDG